MRTITMKGTLEKENTTTEGTKDESMHKVS